MSEEKKTITIFGYPLRDWVIIASLLGFGGGSILGGVMDDTDAVINTQTETLVNEMKAIRQELRVSSQMTQRNTLRIDKMESTHEGLNSRLDSIYGTLMVGLQNLDGYFRGRLDQIQQEPISGDASNTTNQ